MKSIKFILITNLLTLSLTSLAYADPKPAPAQPSAPLYAGYSQIYLQAMDVTPYGNVTRSDVYPLVTGYGLMLHPKEIGFDSSKASDYLKNYDTPYALNFTPSSQYKPNALGRTPIDLTIATMLFNIPGNHILTYLQQADKAFQPPPLSSSTNFNNNNVGNTPQPSSYDYTISDDFAAPYSAASLFRYIPPSNSNNSNNPNSNTNTASNDNPKEGVTVNNNIPVSQKNPGEVYISLVSGALTPVAFPDTATPDFMMRLRKIIATQTAGVYALQNIFGRTQPLNNFDTSVLKQLNNNYPDSSVPLPTNERDLEKFMASRRLHPSSGWYEHLQSASPAELQREQLYLEAEMLYELQKVHEVEEQNELLLAVGLLSQNYSTRASLNQAQQMGN